MKKLSTLLVCLLAGYASYAQNTPWNTTGNIGIGTTNPQSPLNVKGSVTGLIRLTPASDNGEASIQFSSRASETDNSARWAIGPGVFGTRGNFAIGSTIYGNAVATFLTNGNVGIGTINPITPLDVKGNLTLRNSTNATNAGARINFTGYSDNNTTYPGPYVRSSLVFAGEHNYSKLILGSYWDGEKEELTLVNGSVGIGTSDPKGYKLAVAGNIRATEIKVEALPWPDYVFKPTYKLPSLTEVKDYIDKNKHLPDVPSEQEVAKEGISLGEMNRILVKKMEEMTLYMIEKDKQLQNQISQFRALQQDALQQRQHIQVLQKQIKKITKQITVK